MEFQGMGPMAQARRRAYGRIVDACGGDAEQADDMIAALFGDDPSLADLRGLAEDARMIAAEIEEEERKERSR